MSNDRFSILIEKLDALTEARLADQVESSLERDALAVELVILKDRIERLEARGFGGRGGAR